MPAFKPKRVGLREHLTAIVNLMRKHLPAKALNTHPRGLTNGEHERLALRVIAWAIWTQRLTAWARPDEATAALVGGNSPLFTLARDTSFAMDPRFWEHVYNSANTPRLVDTGGRVAIGEDQPNGYIWARCELDAAEADQYLAAFARELIASRSGKRPGSPQPASSQPISDAAWTSRMVADLLKTNWQAKGSAQSEAADWKYLVDHCAAHGVPCPSRARVFRPARELSLSELGLEPKQGPGHRGRQITRPFPGQKSV